MSWALGLGGSSHDYSAALMNGTDIVVAIEEERLTRVKYGLASGFVNPLRRSIRYCLDFAGITMDDVEVVVSSDLLPYRARDFFSSSQLKLYPHHLTHAASAWMMIDGDPRGGIIVYDGLGSLAGPVGPDMRGQRETFSFYEASGSTITPKGTTYGEGFVEHTMFSMGYTNSIGQLYEMVNKALGFGGLESGKTMGLASWGLPRYLEDFDRHLSLGDSLDRVFRFNPFNGFEDMLADIVASEEASFQIRADLAATAQAALERVLEHGYSLLSTTLSTPDVLAIAGGCGLNTVANGRLARKLVDESQMVIPPHSGDAGLGIGALWLHSNEKYPGKPVTFRGGPPSPSISRPGRSYSTEEVMRAATAVYPRLADRPGRMSAEQLAELLANGKIIAVFEGSSEFGPRALGGRSLLGDPRDVAVRERLNRKVKHREPFRPVAPIVLASQFDRYFFPPITSDQFMLKVSSATDLCCEVAPAVVHVDGGARAQVVADESSFIGRVLTRFFELTGVPILVNTSFNTRGVPIVETPAEAFAAFVELQVDGLWAEGKFYEYIEASDGAGRGR